MPGARVQVDVRHLARHPCAHLRGGGRVLEGLGEVEKTPAAISTVMAVIHDGMAVSPGRSARSSGCTRDTVYALGLARYESRRRAGGAGRPVAPTAWVRACQCRRPPERGCSSCAVCILSGGRSPSVQRTSTEGVRPEHMGAQCSRALRRPGSSIFPVSGAGDCRRLSALGAGTGHGAVAAGFGRRGGRATCR